MNDFRAEPPELKAAMLDAARRVLESGQWVLGAEVSRLESQWAAVCGVAHGVGVGNGLDAIEIALRGLDIGPGDEVITTSMTAFATVLAILRAGAIPVLADIEPATALMSLDSVDRCVSRRTRAVLLVHLYGQLRDMDQWQAFCSERNIELVEDCAQAHLASWRGKVAGGFGRFGAYSFYPTKNLGAVGDAGMVVCNDAALANRVTQLRNYGQSTRYQHVEAGMNSRLDEIQAALLAVRLSWLPKFTKRRQRIAKMYQEGIDNPEITLMAPPQEPGAHVYHLYVIRCTERDALRQHMQDCEIQTDIHYPTPVHHQPAFSDVGCPATKRLEHSERHAKQCLSLPCHPQLSYDDVADIVSAANSFRAS